jgi:phage FluMu protein Com
VAERTTRVQIKCRKCGDIDEFEVPASGLEARSKGVPHSAAFPTLTGTRIKHLVEQVCPKCQLDANVAKMVT